MTAIIRSGVALKVSRDDFARLLEAVRTIAPKEPKDRQEDLSQDLAVAFLSAEEPIENVYVWAKVWLKRRITDRHRHDAMQARRLRFCFESGGKPPPTPNRHTVKYPTWFPPHADAREHAPFACSGARLMHVKPDFHGKSDGDEK